MVFLQDNGFQTADTLTGLFVTQTEELILELQIFLNLLKVLVSFFLKKKRPKHKMGFLATKEISIKNGRTGKVVSELCVF